MIEKISIIGNSAAGKSTLSQKLGEARELQIEIIEKFHSDTRPMLLELFATLSPESVIRIADSSELRLSDY